MDEPSCHTCLPKKSEAEACWKLGYHCKQMMKDKVQGSNAGMSESISNPNTIAETSYFLEGFGGWDLEALDIFGYVFVHGKLTENSKFFAGW